MKKYISVDDALTELMNFCRDSPIIEYEPIVNVVHHYLDLVEKKHHVELKDRVIENIKGSIWAKMPYPSDMVKIENELEHLVANIGKMKSIVVGNKVVKEQVVTRKPFKRPPASGRYELCYSSREIITFQGVSLQFPFQAYDLYVLLCRLRTDLQRYDVSAVILQEYPMLIFSNIDLQRHPPLLVFFYNIVETLITDERRKKPELDHLFSSFLQNCLDIVNLARPVDSQINEIFETSGLKLANRETKSIAGSQNGVKNMRGPTFVSAILSSLFDILKGYVDLSHHNEMEELLKNGVEAREPILFLDNGNRLADAFKQLFEANLIVGCEKQELCEWVVRNFRYRYRQEIKEFKYRYLKDIIATNKDKCRNPILNVVNGTIIGIH